MIIDLDFNGYLKISIEKISVSYNKTEPAKLNSSGSKIEKLYIYENADTRTTYQFNHIQNAEGEIVCFESEFFDFVEVFNAYLSKQLDKEQTITVSYQNSNGFTAKIATKNDKESLMIQVKDKRYFFDKYTCRVIANKAKHYFQKCK